MSDTQDTPKDDLVDSLVNDLDELNELHDRTEESGDAIDDAETVVVETASEMDAVEAIDALNAAEKTDDDSPIIPAENTTAAATVLITEDDLVEVDAPAASRTSSSQAYSDVPSVDTAVPLVQTTAIIPPTEALPFVPPEMAAVETSVTSPELSAEDVKEEPRKIPAGHETVSRGTMDAGLFLLRLVVGVIIALRGANILFGIFGGSIEQTQKLLVSLEFTQWTDILAITVGVAQLVAGILLVLGLFTPLGAAVVLGSLGITTLSELVSGVGGSSTTVITYTLPYLAVMIAAASAVILVGAGKWAIDGVWGWATRPKWGAILWWLVGISLGPILWALLNNRGLSEVVSVLFNAL